MEETKKTPLTVRVRILAKVTKERINKYLCILKIRILSRATKKFKKEIWHPEKEKTSGKGLWVAQIMNRKTLQRT